ncbi:hypothetical protein [Rhodococcus ruber]
MAMRYPCQRESCAGTYSEDMHRNGLRYCSALCNRVDGELDSVIHLIQTTDDPDTEDRLTDAYTTLVEAADLLTEYRTKRETAHVLLAKQRSTAAKRPRRPMTQTVGESVSA